MSGPSVRMTLDTLSAWLVKMAESRPAPADDFEKGYEQAWREITDQILERPIR